LSDRESWVALTVTEWGNERQKARYLQALATALARLARLGASKVLIVPQVIRSREDNSGIL